VFVFVAGGDGSVLVVLVVVRVSIVGAFRHIHTLERRMASILLVSVVVVTGAYRYRYQALD
jgi:hypothetical protein